MTTLADTRLVLFFTQGISLGLWNTIGMFEREVAMYRRLRGHVKGITFVTYGNASDLDFSGRLEGIDIVCNRWRLPGPIYRQVVSRFTAKSWQGPLIVKTNQVEGADVALRAARTCGAPFIARCGFLYSYFTEREQEGHSRRIRKAAALERRVFTEADRVVVTTPAMREAALSYGVPDGRVSVTPNYVETDRFRPMPEVGKPPRRVVFVGRLADQKNPFALLDAVEGLDVELYAVGQGGYRPRLMQIARERGIDAKYVGNRPSPELPEIMNSGTVFVLPSLFEGHPKALIEAMACGLPVIGGDSPGIREMISHGENGLLCGTSAPEIRAALSELLDAPALREKLGKAAREFAVANFSLDRVVELELENLRKVAGG